MIVHTEIKTKPKRFLQFLQGHDAQADEEGREDHGGKGDPVPVFIEAVEVLPALFLRGEGNLYRYKRAVEEHREHAPQALGEGHAALFQQAEGNEGHKRGQQVHERSSIRSLIAGSS